MLVGLVLYLNLTSYELPPSCSIRPSTGREGATCRRWCVYVVWRDCSPPHANSFPSKLWSLGLMWMSVEPSSRVPTSVEAHHTVGG
eukprot:scaffold1159_cov160-Ochromonas_danica.AAC.11